MPLSSRTSLARTQRTSSRYRNAFNAIDHPNSYYPCTVAIIFITRTTSNVTSTSHYYLSFRSAELPAGARNRGFRWVVVVLAFILERLIVRGRRMVIFSVVGRTKYPSTRSCHGR